jgi:hypothetical protein
MKTLQDINEAFFGSFNEKIIWFDGKGIIPLTDDINVVIAPYHEGNGWYPGYMVTIINKHSAILDSTLFKFNKYITSKFNKNVAITYPSQLDDNGYGWTSLIEPDKNEVNVMFEAIMQYINLWR